MIGRKPPVSPDSALASDIFDQLCAAGTLKSILHHHRHLCDVLKIKPTNLPHFYPKLKAKLNNWRAQALWNKFDKRAGLKCYNRSKACPQSKVLIIGAGPCGLRAAIEAQFLGARVVVVEKRDRITRNNVLHLWPFVIQDLKGLGAKKFFGKFCAGAIDHISIRQLQCILLKVALILGVEVHEGISFESLLPPPENQSGEKIGWRAVVSPSDHPVSQYEFDVLVGADGKRNTLEGFRRKEFRGKLAIAITANFINRRTEAEARVEEISGVAFIFNQKFFKDLYADTRIDLENIVYYKDDTHYFVMTAKKHSLIDKGVILQDYADTARLLDPANVDKEALLKYAKEAADFSTNYMLPDLDFAVNHYGQPDVAMFDFTSMYAAENASRVVEKNGHKLLQLLVGDSLLEPFWPTGSGCARGFLSSMDACWAIKNWTVNGALSPLDVIAERESIYRLLGQTTPENLQKDLQSYTLDPCTRYPNLNSRSVLPFQVKNLFETDDQLSMELALAPTATTQEAPKKRRRRDSQVHPDTLVQWLKRQVCLHQDLHVENVTYSFRSGLVLCAIINRYRPDLLDFSSLDPANVAGNNQRAFDILEKDLGISPVMTGEEMAECDCPDRLAMLSYLSQVYDAFRGEIPHTKHPRLQPDPEEELPPAQGVLGPRPMAARKRTSPQHRDVPTRKNRKRRSGGEKLSFGGEERQQRIEEIEENRKERMRRRRLAQQLQKEQLKKSLAMMEFNHWSPEEGEGFNDYSLYVYRQTAPEFTDRVKELEMKLLYPDRESRLRAELKNRMAAEPDEDFSGRIKELEEKLKGTAPAQKKPRDLLRAIGKIEKTDWQVKEIEKKIEENRYGKNTSERPEKVPKWSRQQFDDKAMENKLLKKGLDQETASRYAEVDVTLKRLEQKLKDGSSLETGERGSNKVSAMAEQFAQKPEEKLPIQKSGSKGAVVLPTPGSSEKCHFCDKRVYLMEKVNVEGKLFHRSCFKCEYCGTTLRVGSYLFDGEGKYGYRFYCNQHYRMPGTVKQRDKHKTPVKLAVVNANKTPVNKNLTPPLTTLDRGATPERIEFENLAEDMRDAESEMDEDEWTDRNFGASAAEGSSDDMLDMSDSDEEADEVEDALMTADETREVAERWTRKHSGRVSGLANNDLNGQDSCEADDSDDVDDYSEDDDSDTATEGEEDLRALELRKQEVRLLPVKTVPDTDTGSDTEVPSDERSSTGVENSATEISTDSEFDHDGATPTRSEIPDILTAHRRHKPEEPRRVQVKSGLIGTKKEGVKLDFRPLVDSKNIINLKKDPPSRPTPLFNPRRGDYNLSKTQSTEGIATKISLELRKKYLLGGDAAPYAVAKSATATALDSKLKNFASSITECQKLLNPGSEISPTMQAFLQTTNKPRPPTSPTITTPPLNLPPTSIILRSQKELPSLEKDFVHVCGRTAVDFVNENLENTDPNVVDTSDVENKNVAETKDENCEIESSDFRPRSPVHETSIVVPQIPWKKPDENEQESESESESESEESSSDEEEEVNQNEEEIHYEEQLKPKIIIPPRLEITDSHGELLIEDDGFEMDSLQPGNEGHSALSMAAQIEIARCKIDELKNSITRGENAIQGALELDSIEPIIEPIDIPSAEPFDSIEPYLVRPSESAPHSPVSVDDSSHTFPALTETELSDWARDGDLGVSDDLEEDVLSTGEKKAKNTRKPKSLELQNPGPGGFSHVCGRLLASTENLDFMDTEPSEPISATNVVLLENRGYMRLGSNPDITPVDPPAASSSSSSSTTTSSAESKPNQLQATTEESTTSEPTTVRNASDESSYPVQKEAYYWPLVDMSPLSPTKPVEESVGNKVEEKEEFNDYIQRLQGRISPFHNARDSIDYRKSKHKGDKDTSPTVGSPIKELDGESTPPLAIQPQEVLKSPEKVKECDPRSRKLQEISRERNIQKDLVHEMVMKKVLASKKSPGERRTKRILRNSSGILVNVPKPPDTPNNEVPSPSSTTADTSDDVFETPPSTVKRPPIRPTSVHLGTSSLSKCPSTLQDIPVNNSETFSMPNFSVNSVEFKTPIAPPRDRRIETTGTDMASVERERIREEARVRARLKSDEELGLSPEDRVKALKEKALKILDTPKRTTDNQPKRSSVKTSLRAFGSSGPGRGVLKSSSTSTVFDKLRGGDKATVAAIARPTQKSTSDIVTACRQDGARSPESNEPSTSSSSTAKTGEARSRDRERRKSIIQAVSDFFHKKSTSPSKSPTKTPSPSKPDKFSAKFKLNTKNKDKKDVHQSYGLADAPPSNAVPPPIPPPPTSYVPQSFVSEESGSELEDPMSTLSTPSHGTSSTFDPAARRAKMTKRMARQAQLKRLRMAQEIQRRLEEVEEKQKELEGRGVRLEKALRGEEDEGAGRADTQVLRDWFELLRERNELRRYERELLVRAQEMELEDRHARLQQELRDRLAIDDASKTEEEVMQEGVILREMLETVEKRDALTKLLEEERQRYQDEDKDLEAQVLSKGLRLTPIRKYEYQSAV